MTGVEIILVAAGFSRSAAIAVRRAVELARAAGARLELMHVLPPEPIPTRWMGLTPCVPGNPDIRPMARASFW